MVQRSSWGMPDGSRRWLQANTDVHYSMLPKDHVKSPNAWRASIYEALMQAHARWYLGADGWPVTIKAFWSAEARWEKRPGSHLSPSQESLCEARDRCCPFVNGSCHKKSGMFSRTLTGNRIGTTSMLVRKFANSICPWSAVKWRIFICFLWTIIRGKYGFPWGLQTILNSFLLSVDQ